MGFYMKKCLSILVIFLLIQLSSYADYNYTKLTKVPNMLEKRAFFSAVKLNDGRVFISGGLDMDFSDPDALSEDMSALKSTEIYDPKTNEFKKGPNMIAGRSSHSSFVMNDGRVLIIGGNGKIYGNAPLNITVKGRVNTIEIYDPETNTIIQDASLDKDAFDNFNIYNLENNLYLFGGSIGFLRLDTNNPFNIYDLNEHKVYDSNSETDVIDKYTSLLTGNYKTYYDLDENFYAAAHAVNKRLDICNKLNIGSCNSIELKNINKELSILKLNDGRFLVLGILAEKPSDGSIIEIVNKEHNDSTIIDTYSKVICPYYMGLLSKTTNKLLEGSFFEDVGSAFAKRSRTASTINPIVLPDGNVIFFANEGYQSEILNTKNMQFSKLAVKMPYTFEKAVLLDNGNVLLLGQEVRMNQSIARKMYNNAYILQK